MDSGVIIRKMQAKDIDDVMEIEEATFSTPWSRQAMEQETKNLAAHYIVAEIDERIVAYAGAWLVIDEGHITNIAVHPKYRGRGLGRAVLESLIDHLVSVDISIVLLEVRVSNTVAQKLYKGIGFKQLTRRKGYYEDNGEDAYVMLLEAKRVYKKQ